MNSALKRSGRAAAVILAAGRSTRMGPENKLLQEIVPGIPVIRRTVELARACGLNPIYVVTGHEAGKVRAALDGLACQFVHNPDYARGLSGSVRAGFRQAVADGAPGILILLGDMPFLPTTAIEAILVAAVADPGSVVQAVHHGRPAHPVWLPARIAAEVERLDGDRGMRCLVEDSGGAMTSVEVDAAAAFDIDTPEDLAAARQRADAR